MSWSVDLATSKCRRRAKINLNMNLESPAPDFKQTGQGEYRPYITRILGCMRLEWHSWMISSLPLPSLTPQEIDYVWTTPCHPNRVTTSVGERNEMMCRLKRPTDFRSTSMAGLRKPPSALDKRSTFIKYKRKLVAPVLKNRHFFL